jgi:hypothetical protein
VPGVRGDDRVLAILCSDLHLSGRPPLARSVEPDWFEAMARPLREVRKLADRYRCPVVVAGDVCDRWNLSPEVINFAIDEMPVCWAVPGQHDLPNHRYEDIRRSAYWTLVQAGKIVNLKPGEPTTINDGLLAYGFPWGATITPPSFGPQGCTHLAVVHAFIWTGKHTYEGAPQERHLTGYTDLLRGYDAAVFGDNHKGFLAHTAGGTTVLNNGGFMRRTIAEVAYTPQVGILRAGGEITRYELDTTDDKFIDVREAAEVVERAYDMGELVAELAALGATEGLQFTEALKRFMDRNGVSDRVRRIVTQEA